MGTITVYGKSELISRANHYMKLAMYWYGVGGKKADTFGDECAKMAINFFSQAQRTHNGAYRKTI
jgi:hypothetical protein